MLPGIDLPRLSPLPSSFCCANANEADNTIAVVSASNEKTFIAASVSSGYQQIKSATPSSLDKGSNEGALADALWRKRRLVGSMPPRSACSSGSLRVRYCPYRHLTKTHMSERWRSGSLERPFWFGLAAA